MSYNTTLNPRILLAEIAVYKLNNAFKARLPIRYTLSKKEIADIIKNMNSAVQVLKYSYISDDKLAKHEKTLELSKDAEKLYDCVIGGYRPKKELKTTIYEATIYWCCRLLKRLPIRLLEDLAGRKIEAGLDTRIVGIRNIGMVEGTNLFITRVYDGHNDFTIVTNITSLKAGMKVVASFLPPAEVGGIVSEAMFLGGKEYPSKEYGTQIVEASFSEVRSILKEEFIKMKTGK
ncbi:MAG: hypothetical protein ACXAEU_23555 [Candidatus Hodarchaeales archaeon]|jgi:predicted RNA-binding protein with EMAP domain